MKPSPIMTCAIALLASVGPVSAHEFWLSPDRFGGTKGTAVEVGAFVGTGFRGEEKPYAATRALRWTLRTNREFDLRKLAMNGDFSWARFVSPDDGGALLAFESDWTPIELPAPDFDRYLTLEGLDGPLHARAGRAPFPGRERYARCAKLWLAGSDPTRATRPVGLPLELVPLTAPGSTPALRVRLLYRGRPLAGAKLRAFRQPLGVGSAPRDPAARDSVGPAVEIRTDRDGLATVRLDWDGEWLLNAVHMVPSEDRAAADWQSLWASLCFVRASTPAAAMERKP